MERATAETCMAYVPSTTRIILETFFIIGLPLAYLPQFLRTVRNGTSGLSDRYVLMLALFSTMQLASRLANPFLWPLSCIYRGGLQRGLDIFGALLSYVEVAVQWACAMIWLGLFASRRTVEETSDAIHPDETTPLRPSISPDRMPSGVSRDRWRMTPFTLVVPTLVIATTLISLALVNLLLPSPDPDAGMGGIGRALEMIGFHFLCLALTLIFVILAMVPTIRDAAATAPGRVKGVSIMSLSLQILAMLVLGVLQATTPAPNTVDRDQGIGTYLSGWYLFFGYLPINYWLLSVAHGVALYIRVRREGFHDS